MDKTEEGKMLSVDEAVKRLRAAGFTSINGARLREGMKQRVYPFGEAIQMREWVFNIYATLLQKWIDERS